jgi:hypothetical protein
MNSENVWILIRRWLVQAQTALDDAKFLLDAGRSPASIINRSYYAMFYAITALLQSVGETPSKHAGVISLFDREFVAKGIFPKELSKQLHGAFDLRQTSDYRDEPGITRQSAAELWQAAADFVKEIRIYLEKREEESH